MGAAPWALGTLAGLLRAGIQPVVPLRLPQLFLTGVIGHGWGALAAADAMLSSLGEVQAVLDARVNVTGTHGAGGSESRSG